MKCFACVLPLLWLVVLAGEYEEYIEGYDLVHDIGGINQCHEGVWHLARLGDEVCIKGLGCFKLTKDYFHPQYRPCNVLPEPRSLIHTKFVLFTRNNIHQGKFLVADNETSIRESGFNANHSTRFIIHGYQENPLHDAWVLILMREFLNYNDTNVVIVDWSAGSQAPYIQAVANARVVGAEIARMVNALKKFGNLTTSMLHIIGNGLGAHVAGYAGQSILPMVSRITGLDPAYKYFCNMPMNVRLDPMDADFVDVIHTELKDYDAGHGGCHKLGHLDFFPNDQTPAAHQHYEVYEYRIRMQLEHINSKPENHSRSGNLLLLLRGEKKPLFVHLRFYSMHDGKEYTFLVTSSVNIGDVREVSARWEEPGIYDEHFYSGQPVWNFRDSNVNIPMMNITLLNFDPSGENTGPTEISFCKSGEVNEQGWMTYVQNC
ncbi:pancreatic lipase-related protein 2-like isoform X3 [Stegodyphus dumicola]|uniref:pancreatic lipase-related protein 2-like isoform X3 n=1 Tax=Stegodyphus dumicola TaxID=202533 RepID=UPI0015B18843|nr:pancreatic lipase-related protein 2-like isoform X3 [Stegodyphus dumicola]